MVMQQKGEGSGGGRETTGGLAVAVAVKGVTGDSSGGAGSRRAAEWAAVNLLPKASRFFLVHVIPTITSVPTPTGGRIQVDELDELVAEMYVRDIKLGYQQVLEPFKNICGNNSKVQTLVLEHDDPAKALIGFVSKSRLNSLVMGSSNSDVKKRESGVPSTVLRYIPTTCEIYIISKEKIVTISIDPLSNDSETESFSGIYNRTELYTLSAKEPEIEPFSGTYDRTELHTLSSKEPEIEPFSGTGLPRPLSVNEPETEPLSTTSNQTEPHSSSGQFLVWLFGASRRPQHKRSKSAKEPKTEDTNPTYSHTRPYMLSGLCSARPYGGYWLSQYSVPPTPSKPVKPVKTHSEIKKEEMEADVKLLKEELKNTTAKYNQACEELLNVQNNVQILTSECFEEARRVNAAVEEEETMRKTMALEKAKHLEALKEVEAAKALHAKELFERQIAEANVISQKLQKKRVIDRLLMTDGRYSRFTMEEIEKGTGFFSPENVIGEGGSGKVYKCSLHHTPVAVKVLKPYSFEKKEEFLKEVEVLSQLRHPHLVLLLGACPEGGCLVYEYMENGSLREHIYLKNNKPPLPWFIRFRIIFEVACGLAFLHNSKPEPIIHRDLKPGNILLDRNYVSKIGDVGLAKLVPEVVPDDVTTYQNSVLAGTLYYIDPEYQRTGTIRPKSDLYAFGIVILQLLTGRHPNGILPEVEDAIKKGTFTEMLDMSVTDWPLAEAEELARIGLKCSEIRCRDRPDLETEVIPVLKRLAEAANAKIKIERSNLRPPSHYFCPILREVMEDPHVAADGFTYERRAITAWLEKHSESPVTKQNLKHFLLTPNHTLRSAIQDWRSRVTFANALIHKYP